MAGQDGGVAREPLVREEMNQVQKPRARSPATTLNQPLPVKYEHYEGKIWQSDPLRVAQQPPFYPLSR